jgi:hypothetical protein
MHKLHIVSVVLLAFCGFKGALAGDTRDLSEWNKIKAAVCKKKGDDFTKDFNVRFPQFSQEGVHTLAEEIDNIGENMPMLGSLPPQLHIKIGGAPLYILWSGACGKVIREVSEIKQQSTGCVGGESDNDYDYSDDN